MTMLSISESKKTLVLIPARAGSKGLPGKNTRPLAGKPLLAWSIDAARKAGLTQIEVSTDSEEIAAIARSHGARVPALRPTELARDTASSFEVIQHCLQQATDRGEEYEQILLLQPTSPLRCATDIAAAFQLMQNRNAEAIVSVTTCDHHPWWSNGLPENGNMADFLRPEVRNCNRQQLPPYYRLNGAIYLAEISSLQQQQGFIGPRTHALIMPAERSVDIDSLLDFQLAELLINQQS